jgi:glycosyltransferase involved in cell wall biosynthesis
VSSTGTGQENHLAAVCLVVPCYNEAKRLDIASFRSFLAEGTGVRLLFVDDGSRDRTVEVLESVRAGYEDCASILCRPQNGGKAEAVRLGVLHALDRFQPAFVGFWDADLATPLDALSRFSKTFAQKAAIEMVFGARVQLLGRHIERRAPRHYAGRVFASIVSVLLRMKIYDTQCGAKLFRVTSETRQIFADPFLSKWVFDVEILARYQALLGRTPKQLQQTIYEYPLETWTDIAGSKVHAGDFLMAFADVLRIYWKYFAGTRTQTRR